MTDRARFEEWAKSLGCLAAKQPDGTYASWHCQSLWRAWQAARAWRPISEAPEDGSIIVVRGGLHHCEDVSFEFNNVTLDIPAFAKWDAHLKRYADPDDLLHWYSPTEFYPLPPEGES